MSKTIDCRGLACPKPVILTKKELDSIDSGEVVSIVDNDVARQNVLKFAESAGCSAAAEEKDGLFYITITKSSCSKTSDTTENNIVIFVASDKFGAGDDKLGTALMKSYMYALSESDAVPKTMLFANGGVKLTTEGSDVLESLKALSQKGVEIMSCGTCLDFYGLKEKLVVGTVTNMYTIVDRMNKAVNTIRI
jgi:selenium metabolism protein YedF